MNDKDRELLAQILKSGGAAAQQGFTQLVRYAFIDGVTTIIFCALIFFVCAYLFYRLIYWKVEEDETALGKGLGLVVVTIVAVVMLCCVQAGFRDALAPEGAAVLQLLHR